MKKLIYLKDLNHVLDPNDIIITDNEAFQKHGIIEFEIPDKASDYMYDPKSLYLYYVLDGKIKNLFVPNAQI